jgi:hypothetical protein
MIEEAVERVKTAVNASVKQEHGEDAYVHGSIVITLVELPKDPKDGPGATNAFTAVATTHGLPTKALVQMLADGAEYIKMRRDEEGQ